MKQVISVKCGFEGCNEHGHYEVENRKHASEIYEKYGGGKYRCVRHTNMEELLSLSNNKIIKFLTVQKDEKLKELYFNGRYGFVHGNGYKAFAKDFPEGTQLKITAEIIFNPQFRKDE